MNTFVCKKDFWGCLWDNLKPSFLPHLIFNWRTFSSQVAACWWRQWARNQVSTNQNSRNRWCHIVRRTICLYEKRATSEERDFIKWTETAIFLKLVLAILFSVELWRSGFHLMGKKVSLRGFNHYESVAYNRTTRLYLINPSAVKYTRVETT